MKNILTLLGKKLKNKYIIVTLIFLVLVFFFSENNLRVLFHLQAEVKSLHDEESLLISGIEQDSLDACGLGTIDALEHYGREQYYMRRSDEDIFIIKEEE